LFEDNSNSSNSINALIEEKEESDNLKDVK
jgi:hypothetical protein